MILYVDCDLHQVIQGAGARSPVNPIAFKSQDTPALNIYFVSQGVVLDLGESPVVEFGLVVPAAPTVFLSYNASFTRQVDVNGLVYYQAFPTFNTTETVAALAADGAPVPLPVTGEIRYQLSDGEIVHTLNIPFLIWPTILVEGGTPDPTAIPGYPAVAAIELKSNKNIPSGYAGLDSGGLLLLATIPAGVELTANKNTTNGYAGLIAGLLTGSQIPVDGTTTQIVGGKIVAVGPALGVLAVATEAFTVPAIGSNVTISAPTSSLTVGLYYVISGGAGSYSLVSITDATHGVFQNLGGSTNAVPGTVISFPVNIQWSGPPGISVPGPAGPTGAVGTSFTWRGAWVSGTAYNVNDVVSQSGSTYICILANTGNNPLTDGGVHWSQMVAAGTNGTNGVSFIWLGAWSSGTAYVANNVVSQAGSTWINILANTGSTPSTDGGVHWALMAEVGSSTGDMTKAVYDTADRGYVDRAVLADTATVAAGLSAAITESQVTGLVTDLGTLATDIAAKLSTSALVDAETSTGDTLLGSTAGQVKRLIAGTNVTLDTTTTPGAVIVNSSGGGGGSGPFALITAAGADITYGDAVPITFTSAVSDAASMWNGSTHLTVPTTGFYLVQASFSLAWTTAGIIGVNIFRNWGVSGGGLQKTVSGAAGEVTQDTISGTLSLTAGDTICLVAFSSIGYSSGALPTTWKATAAGAANSNGIGPCQSLSILKVA